MDNITHSLLGAAFAMFAAPESATRGQRRLFLAAGIAAANAPDLDLVYVGIMPAPLGYLLHHRGHTHTLAGLAALGALFGLATLVPPIARVLAAPARAGLRLRFALLMAAGLISHLLLDACNSYGVHPFYPFGARWVYGDSLFIIEPWLWLLLAAALPWQALSRRTGIVLVLLLALFAAALMRVDVIHIVTVASMALTGAAIGWSARHLPRQRRALAGLTAAALFVGGMFGASRLARVEAAAALAPRVQGEIVDIVLSPNPASPWCWAVIGVERDARADRYALHRGTLSLMPSLKPAASCVTHRLLNQPVAPDTQVVSGGPNGQDSSGQRSSGLDSNGQDTNGRGANGQGASVHADRGERDDRRVAWTDEIRAPLASLRDLEQRDCWSRAWLQFGRAPFIHDGALQDLRFANGGRRNFTMMTLTANRAAGDCPPHVTPWGMPRADLLR